MPPFIVRDRVRVVSSKNGGATGAAGGDGGSDRYTTFERITLTLSLTVKGEKRGQP